MYEYVNFYKYLSEQKKAFLKKKETSSSQDKNLSKVEYVVKYVDKIFNYDILNFIFYSTLCFYLFVKSLKWTWKAKKGTQFLENLFFYKIIDKVT